MSGDASHRGVPPSTCRLARLLWHARRTKLARSFPFAPVIAALLLAPAIRSQELPKLVIDQDCSSFAISAQNDIVYSVPHLKFIKKYILERDDIYISSANGKANRIVDAEKFISTPPMEGFTVHSLSWSPDGKRIAVNMALRSPPAWLKEQIEEKKNKQKVKKRRDDSDDEDDDSADYAPPVQTPGRNVVALFDSDGRQIQVPGAASPFIGDASNAVWLAGDQTVAYMSADQIMSMRPADGTATKLFEGHSFQAVAWDSARNRAFAVGDDLTVKGGLALVELDLVQQRVTPIASLAGYRSSLSVSPSGTKVGFFADGDTIEVIDVRNPSKPVRVHAGLGWFQWDRNEDRVLLKRGPEDQSNDLVWVSLRDGSFVPALHDLEFRAYQIAPDGYSLAVTEPGKRILKIFPLE